MAEPSDGGSGVKRLTGRPTASNSKKISACTKHISLTLLENIWFFDTDSKIPVCAQKDKNIDVNYDLQVIGILVKLSNQ